MKSISCRAILFDMDGTLVDSNEASEITWQSWAKENGVDIAAIRAVHHGRRPEETIAIVAPHLNALEAAKQVYEEQGAISAGIYPIKGANDFYNALPHGSYGIVTAATHEILEHRFRLVGLSIPKVCITAKLLKKGKPDPEGYLMGAAKLGFDPKDCIVFEDAPSGLLAAKRAGMRSVAVTTHYTPEQLAKEMGADFEAVASIANYRTLQANLAHYKFGDEFEIRIK